MRREELEHVVSAAANVVGETEIVVVGSQAILAQHPDAPASLLVSMEADVYPRDRPGAAIEIDGAIGDGSQFHETFGYYAHGVGPETPVAPAGWEDRLIAIEVPGISSKRGTIRAWCLEAHDLSLAKLAAGRPHDLQFVEDLLRAGLVDREQLLLGVDLMPPGAIEKVRAPLRGVLSRV